MTTTTKTADEIMNEETQAIADSHISGADTSKPAGIYIRPRDIQESTPALNELMTMKTKPQSAFRIKAVARCVNRAMKEFEGERIALCQSLGTENKELNKFEFSEENQIVFDGAMAELLEKEMFLPLMPLKLRELGDVPLSADFLLILDWLIVEN